MEEIWKFIKGYEGSYQVSNIGNVRSVDRAVKGRFCDVLHHGKVLSQSYDKDGYKLVSLHDGRKRKVFKVHRLVYEAFVEDLNNDLVIDHINNNRADNRVENLQQIDCRLNVTKDRVTKDKLPHGIYKNREKYISSVMLNSKRYYLGTYDTIDDANIAREQALENFNNNGEMPTLKRQRDMHNDGYKVCTCCGKRLPMSDYYFSKKYNFYQSKCKPCHRKQIYDIRKETLSSSHR